MFTKFCKNAQKHNKIVQNMQNYANIFLKIQKISTAGKN